MTPNLDELQRLAQAVEDGEWYTPAAVASYSNKWIVGPDAAYIAAADPQTVLRLIAVAKAAQAYYDAWNGGDNGAEIYERIIALRAALKDLE